MNSGAGRRKLEIGGNGERGRTPHLALSLRLAVYVIKNKNQRLEHELPTDQALSRDIASTSYLVTPLSQAIK